MVFFVLVVSIGTGLILGGPDKAQKLVVWELKQLKKFGRWTLKQTLQVIVDVCRWVQSKL
ncbi:MAG: hypothetical protein WC666_03205 [Candidatus Paceibacterota bacterium]